MPKYQKFENLPVWQEAARLYNRVLDLLDEPNLPLSSAYRNQLDRGAVGIQQPRAFSPSRAGAPAKCVR
jgi:hypothetical protein